MQNEERTVSPLWAGTAETLLRLHIGRTQLQKLKSTGVLEPGKHWRKEGKKIIKWDVLAIDKTLREIAVQEAQAAGQG